ncbi:FixH family protein [Kordia sp. YSTF-M3]|uniref:FixH family protein n=1 Tax=Kordia aestuariivivens TaxID=2759037 RepID=A0ABR7QFD6_9FLAO|nr:FixH family protein [Kordia aestuariivivens]MBC8757267.1 FixH family protein [Kordia aestuariivivens]
MKINWGTGIVLAFIAFISFIMFFVVRMNVQSEYDHDLVTDSYYEEELKYQKDIDKQRNAQKLLQNVTSKQTAAGIEITFPETFAVENIKGKVFLYRPSNRQFDFEIPISLSNHTLLIPDNRLLGGRWNITVDWNYKKEYYLYKEEITY